MLLAQMILIFKRKLIRNRFCILILLIILIIFYNIFKSKPKIKTSSGKNLSIELINHFLEVESLIDTDLLIDLPNCKILNLAALMPKKRRMKPVICDAQNRTWTFVNQTNLIVNESAITNSGFTFAKLECCFQSYRRLYPNETEDHDKQIRYSGNCTKIVEIITPIENEFIKVTCRNLNGNSTNILYKKFHIFAQPLRSLKTMDKIEYWTKSLKNVKTKPPNVVIIGIDTVSRLSSVRNLPKTRKILENLGAIEFLGYTKVGEKTFPNLVPKLFGYSETELGEICYNKSRPFDSCPFIWNDFDRANYLTSEIEDVPPLATFNYIKEGFIEQPVDFYYRPFNIGPYNDQNYSYNYTLQECIGYEKNEKNQLNYAQDLLQMSAKVGVPIFLHLWQNSLNHDDFDGVLRGDETFADFFEKIDLHNTLLVFMSDHGFRYGKFRNTFPGWLEARLPVLYIALSPDLKVKYPHWQTNLKENSRKLTTPYDLYQTMTDILKITSNITISPSTLPNGQLLPRKFGQSLISTIVDNSTSCSDAGIPDEYCACIIPKKVHLDDPKLKSAAEQSLDHIYSFLPHEFCSKLYLKSIYSGALLEKTRDQVNYIVGFQASPGEFQFEANIPYFWANESFSFASTRITRVNKMNTNVSCVESSFLELYCYCL